MLYHLRDSRGQFVVTRPMAKYMYLKWHLAGLGRRHWVFREGGNLAPGVELILSVLNELLAVLVGVV